VQLTLGWELEHRREQKLRDIMVEDVSKDLRAKMDCTSARDLGDNVRCAKEAVARRGTPSRPPDLRHFFVFLENYIRVPSTTWAFVVQLLIVEVESNDDFKKNPSTRYGKCFSSLSR